MTRYKYPPYVAGLVDIDYWDKLTDADRKWLQKFSAEYYADHFTRTPIHTDPEHQAECSRRYSQARRDAAPFAFSVETSARGPGSRQFSDLDERFKQWGHVPPQLDITDLDLERPEVKALLAEARALAPEGDPHDSRKRLKFRSPLHETRFYQLREKLAVLLKGETV